MKYKLKATFFLLSAFCILFPALNAQIDSKNELKLTPEIKEMVVTQIKQFLTEKSYSDFGIKNRAQLENLRLGKPIPNYCIESYINKQLVSVSVYSASHISEGKSFSLRFMDTWNVPVMVDETLLFFAVFAFSDGEPFLIQTVKSTTEYFQNYEPKDSIIGSVCLIPSSGGMDHLIIRKENQDVFVQIYGEKTGEYFNVFSLSELINHLKEVGLSKQREQMEAQMRYYVQVANKSELKMTPEITKMVVSILDSVYKNVSDEMLPEYGIENRSKLENLHLGKPIPRYIIVNENLTFIGMWNVPVMSKGEPVLLARVELADDGEYIFVGASAYRAKLIHSYEHKDLIVGFLGTRSFNGMDYVIIRKENKDIFVGMSDYATRDIFKNEYSLSEIINLLKK